MLFEGTAYLVLYSLYLDIVIEIAVLVGLRSYAMHLER